MDDTKSWWRRFSLLSLLKNVYCCDSESPCREKCEARRTLSSGSPFLRHGSSSGSSPAGSSPAGSSPAGSSPESTGSSGTSGSACSKNAPESSSKNLSPPKLPACVSKNHPGLFRHLHDSAQSVMPRFFQGALFRMRHNIGSHWTMAHSLTFSQIFASGYTMTGTYCGDDEDLRMPHFLLEAAPDGYVSVEARGDLFDDTRATVVGQFAKSKAVDWECFFDAYLTNGALTLMTVKKQILAAQYIHALGPKISVGVETMTLYGGGRSLVGAIRYTGEQKTKTLSLSFGDRGIALCMSYLLTSMLTVAARIDYAPSLQTPLLTVAYQYKDTERESFVARASVDTDGLVGATYERFLGSSPRFGFLFALSSLYNLANDKFEVGFGLTAVLLGSSPVR